MRPPICLAVCPPQQLLNWAAWAHPALTFREVHMKEDCVTDRGITPDLVVYLAVSCPNLIECGGLYSC
jgi:hypothetical protein